MRKLHFLLIGFLLPIFNLVAQTTYNGRIVDEHKQPLSGATIIEAIKSTNGTTTDLNGNFEIILNSPQVIVSYMGYITKKVTLTTTQNNEISLSSSNVSLNEVVVSGSRETQSRKEVPAAISSINKKELNQLKAFGIEQILNTVPGVFMQSSMVSSNEQHQMSLRSPNTTKGLFLYMEDGIPIRPTAVFNHNALLEMNTTALERIEVLKGPASSIYGSEAIGGSFNFITKNPTRDLTGSAAFQMNDLGFKRYELEASNYLTDKFGVYVGGQYSERNNGPVEHSDYNKLALTFKTVYNMNSTTKWTNLFDYVDYDSDMTGSVSEQNFYNGQYQSNETFTNRTAKVYRFRSTLDKIWNSRQKTSFNIILRDNTMGQIPSYRTNELRNDDGSLTGKGTGEINSNSFKSYAALIQHKIDFSFGKSSLITGVHFDYSPQDYVANTIDFDVDIKTEKNINYTENKDDFILNYHASIFNYAGYAQYEITPLPKLKVTTAVRFDQFMYNYDNHIPDIAGVADNTTHYSSISPKLGFNYNLTNHVGFYGNTSKGFAPPPTSTLYQSSSEAGGDVFNLKPSTYYNYEIGGYFSVQNKLKVDVSLYDLEGKDVLVSYQTAQQTTDYRNAGKTRSYGLEYGIKYLPFGTDEFEVIHNGTIAKHRYLNYTDGSKNYSDTDMEFAPLYQSYSALNYHPVFLKNFNVLLQHEFMSKYNTSYENSASTTLDDDTKIYYTPTYKGYSIFNLKASYQYKHIEFWAQMLNIFDTLYSVKATYSYSRTTYMLGNPRAFHFGLKYHF
ncbi:TonB-dependent receptor domain-containing protein [Zhouia sp. PK063]|uniref:TonB-dependent receptor domain-containing protein n=1 Tax=Zhouia sp. PK063 TaxID=3373602 RepID=UPI0037AF816D